MDLSQVNDRLLDRLKDGLDRFSLVTDSMEADDYYRDHSREECAVEWRRRYLLLEEAGL